MSEMILIVAEIKLNRTERPVTASCFSVLNVSVTHKIATCLSFTYLLVNISSTATVGQETLKNRI